MSVFEIFKRHIVANLASLSNSLKRKPAMVSNTEATLARFSVTLRHTFVIIHTLDSTSILFLRSPVLMLTDEKI